MDGLRDLSSRPYHSPRATYVDVVGKIPLPAPEAEEFCALLDGVVIDDAKIFNNELREWEDAAYCLTWRRPSRQLIYATDWCDPLRPQLRNEKPGR